MAERLRRPRDLAVPARLAPLIEAACGQPLRDWLARQAGRAIDPLFVEAVHRFVGDLGETAEAQRSWVTSEVGSPETPKSETAPASRHDRITTSQAADLLGVTPRRVRQLLDEGVLPGRRSGWTWTVDALSVTALAAGRRSA